MEARNTRRLVSFIITLHRHELMHRLRSHRYLSASMAIIWTSRRLPYRASNARVKRKMQLCEN